jgi:hypothetical protein
MFPSLNLWTTCIESSFVPSPLINTERSAAEFSRKSTETALQFASLKILTTITPRPPAPPYTKTLRCVVAICENCEEKSETGMELTEREFHSWLETKLEYNWGSEKTCPILTQEILHLFNVRYNTIENNYKLRLIFALYGMKKKNINESFAEEISLFLRKAKNDTEQWTKFLAEIISPILSEEVKFNTGSSIQAFSRMMTFILDSS